MKPISLSSFRGHVQNMHDDRAKGFEAEYQVSYTGCVVCIYSTTIVMWLCGVYIVLPLSCCVVCI